MRMPSMVFDESGISCAFARIANCSLARNSLQIRSFPKIAESGWMRWDLKVVPTPGFELGTYRLQGGCSTN